MKILAISDSVDPLLYDHFNRARWTDVDLVVSCGDLPPSYLDFLCTSLNCPVVYVRGNHDSIYPCDAYSGCINLHGRSWSYKGLTLVGFEGSKQYNGRDLQYSEREMAKRVHKVTKKLPSVDLVVTHAPPLACNDLADPCHQGFACYRDLIHSRHPRYLIHGHSHLYNRASRVARIESTTTVNAFGRYEITV